MKRFSVVENGYDINEVNRFIDVVIKRLEQLDNEAKEYREKLEDANKKLNEKKLEEDKINKALFAIQETTDRLKNLAKQEADMIIEDARRNANAIIHESLLEASQKQKETMQMQKNITVYKARVKSLLESQLKIIEDLDKVELYNGQSTYNLI